MPTRSLFPTLVLGFVLMLAAIPPVGFVAAGARRADLLFVFAPLAVLSIAAARLADSAAAFFVALADRRRNGEARHRRKSR